MALFRYTGRTNEGKLKSGRMEADSRNEVIKKAHRDGIAIFSVEELSGILYKEITLFEKGVKSQDFVIYIRQFSTLLKAGISVVDTTNILASQTNSKKLKVALEEVEEDLREGNPFSTSAEKYPTIFPSLFINMIKAGEAGGNLDEILDRLADYYEKQHATRSKVLSALSYPAVVGAVALIAVIFLLSTVVPTFADMFQSFGSELPAITRLVMSAGDFTKSYWWIIIFWFIGLYLVFIQLRKKKETKYYLDYVFLKMPVFGKLLQKAALARMTRTLSSLFGSSVPILQAVSIVERIVGNEVIERVLREAKTSLEKGESMVGPMERHWIFPPLVTQMISVGEKTGSIDTMLDKVADFYETEVENATDQMKALIEPIMIVILSVIVGVIVLSIAIPMFSMFEQIR